METFCYRLTQVRLKKCPLNLRENLGAVWEQLSDNKRSFSDVCTRLKSVESKVINNKSQRVSDPTCRKPAPRQSAWMMVMTVKMSTSCQRSAFTCSRAVKQPYIVHNSHCIAVSHSVRGVNLGGGQGDTSPQNLEWGTPMYNIPRF